MSLFGSLGDLIEDRLVPCGACFLYVRKWKVEGNPGVFVRVSHYVGLPGIKPLTSVEMIDDTEQRRNTKASWSHNMDPTKEFEDRVLEEWQVEDLLASAMDALMSGYE